MATKSRSAISGKYVSKAKAKAAPKTTVTETTKRPFSAAMLTIDTKGMNERARARLSFWLYSKAWMAQDGPRTYTYNPAKWKE